MPLQNPFQQARPVARASPVRRSGCSRNIHLPSGPDLPVPSRLAHRAHRWVGLLVAGVALFGASQARAAGGDVDLFGGVGGVGSSYIQSGTFQRSGGQWLGELGATLGLGESGLALAGAVELGFGQRLEPGGWLGVRNTFGRGRVATWADLDLAVRWTEGRFDLGPRVGIGVRWELWPSWALYASGSGRLGLLGGLRGDLAATVGLMGLFTLGG